MRRILIIVALLLLTACGSSPVVTMPTAVQTTRSQPNMLATLIADATRVTVLSASAKLNGTWQHHDPDYQVVINLSAGQIRTQEQGTETILPVALDSESGTTVVLTIVGREKTNTFRFINDDVLEWDDAETGITTLTRVKMP